jgi:acyl carrier protein
MMSVEEEFDLTIDEEAVKAFRTVADVASYIDDNI